MRDKIALLVIDVQKGLFERSTPVYRADDLLDTISALVDRAHHTGAPVVYVQHANKANLKKRTDGWQLHPRLKPAEGDLIIHKRHGNAFEETGLDDELKARNVGCVAITGLVTHGCVKATCIGGEKLGYRVILVKDGHSSFSKQAGDLIEEWNRKLGEGVAELCLASEVDFGGSAVASSGCVGEKEAG